jgi:putative long chain acyl-CoA synthase
MDAPRTASANRGSATARRRRQVRWGRRLRRLGMAWQNGLEIVRAGRLTSPYSEPYEVLHVEPTYRLRRYAAHPDPGAPRIAAPILLVPPLMVASEVYDIAPDVSAIGFLGRAGVDVWVVDFGAPERQEGGMNRTLDDHVRAVSDAIDRVHAATQQPVHLAGYSQGGMFAYQAAAFRRSANLASIITFGSPVDLHRVLPVVTDEIFERLANGLRAAIEVPLERVDGLPGIITSTAFKLVSVRKEVGQMFDFVRKLHDRKALEKREAKRLFLRGAGFVAWPGPALRKFVDDVIVGNRMSSGGFVIDGRAATLADITVPILYFLGERDEIARPASVRGVRRASPHAELYEIPVRAGHFGLVVGTQAQTVTWPAVVDWLRYREGLATLPARAIAIGDARDLPARADDDDDDDDADHDDEDFDSAFGELQLDVELAQDIVGKTARAVLERIGDVGADLGDYLDNLRWQVPRLARLRRLADDTPISLGRTLAEQASSNPDRTFFLWRGRAFTYADANRRIDAVVRGLIACGVRAGQRVGVLMQSRPSHLSVVGALSRLGAVAVLFSPETPDSALPRAFEAGEIEMLVVDPDIATRARATFGGKVLMLGGVGEPAGSGRSVPAGVIDMEAIDPAAVALPTWYRPDPGRARDLAIVFVTSLVDSGRADAPRASRITNRRWAFSALGAAAACTLTPRDTIYCCLPLYHPAGMLVATGSALVGGSRLALASRFAPDTFWDEVRRYGVTVAYYAGEMCRSLVDAPYTVGEKNHPVRLFAGSGMRADVWRRLLDRFGGGVLEFYASTEASAVLANASGEKIGALGRPLPGSPELAIVAYDWLAEDFVRDPGGHLVRARQDEPGMLVARLDNPRGNADIAHIAPTRLLLDAFEPGDTWFVTGDLLRVDADGDYWFVDRHSEMIRTAEGPVASQRIEDALYHASGVVLTVAVGVTEGEDQVPAAAFVLAPGASLDLGALSEAVLALPEFARPRYLRPVPSIAMTYGFRPLKGPIAALDFRGDDEVLVWDAGSLRYHRQAAPITAPNAAATPHV